MVEALPAMKLEFCTKRVLMHGVQEEAVST